MAWRLDQLIDKAVRHQQQRKNRLASLLAMAEASLKAEPRAQKPKKIKAGEMVASPPRKFVDPHSVTPESFAKGLLELVKSEPHNLTRPFLDFATFRLTGLSWNGSRVLWDRSPIETWMRESGAPALKVTPGLLKAIEEVLEAATAYRTSLAKKLSQALPMAMAPRFFLQGTLTPQQQKTRRASYLMEGKSKVLLEVEGRLWVWRGGISGYWAGNTSTVYEVVPRSKFKGLTFDAERKGRAMELSSAGLGMYPGGEIYAGEVMTVKGQPYVHTGVTMSIPARPISEDFYAGNLVRVKNVWHLVVQEGNSADKHPEFFQAVPVDKLVPYLAAVAKGDATRTQFGGYDSKFIGLLASKKSLLPKPVRVGVDEVQVSVHRMEPSDLAQIPELLREPSGLRDTISRLMSTP